MGTKQYLDPIRPGEILREDFLKPLGISINRLSRELSVSPNRVSEIVNGKRAITAKAGYARNPMSCILAERSKVKGERRVSFEL